tara:strand:+ start:580 stop:1803 length:1224 start_codon:yes stop_codon:yes gene_type:complete
MKSKIIITRPWNLEYFNDLSKYIEHSTIIQESLFENQTTNKKNIDFQNDILFNDETLLQIIRNCRVLRRFPYNDSIKLINFTIDSFYKFKLNKYDYIISLTVDNYILDVICRLCELENNKFIGLVNSPIPGYIRHTKFGEFNHGINGPNFEKIQTFYSEKMRPTHYILLKGRIKIELIIKDWLRSKLFYLKNIFGDKSYHTYANIYFYQNLKNNFKYKEITKPPDEYIFIPLQCTPECTLDYWSPIRSDNNYEKFIINYIYNNSDINFIIKEHPAMAGKRDNHFYKKVSGFKNCEFVNMNSDSSKWAEKSTMTLIRTGTIGIESFLTNNKILVVGPLPYYFIGCSVEKIKLGEVVKPSEKNINTVIQNLKNCLIPGNILLKRTFTGKYTYDKGSIKLLGPSLNNLLK